MLEYAREAFEQAAALFMESQVIDRVEAWRVGRRDPLVTESEELVLSRHFKCSNFIPSNREKQVNIVEGELGQYQYLG